jgi:hypothetical protein
MWRKFLGYDESAVLLQEFLSGASFGVINKSDGA